MFSNGSGFGKYVIIFGADRSTLVHNDNKRIDILVFGKGPTDGLDDTMLTTKKEYSIDFTEQQKKFRLSLDYNWLNSYIFVNSVEEVYKYKAKDSEINAMFQMIFQLII